MRKQQDASSHTRGVMQSGVVQSMRDPVRRRIAFAILLILALGLPLVANSYWIDIADDMLIWATLTLGLNVVVGLTGLLDLGYIAFFAIGGYTFGILGSSANWNAWECIPVALILVAFASIIIGFPTLRLKSDYLAIMTLGFGEIIYIAVNNLNGITGGPNGLYSMPTPYLFGVPLLQPSQFYWVMLVLLLVTIVGLAGVRHSRFGRAMLAVRQDETAARATGVPVIRIKLLAYVLGAVWAGAAGVLFVAKQTIVSPSSFEFNQSFYVLASVILGGMGSLPGSIVGGCLFIVISESLQGVGQDYSGIIFSVALLVMILVRPRGIWPMRLLGTRDLLHRSRKSSTVPHDVDLQNSIQMPGAHGRTDGLGASPTVTAGEPGETLLTVRNVSLRYGGLQALKDVSITVHRGEILAIIGPNGAGKTSLLNVLSGFARPQEGQVIMAEKDVTRLSADVRARLGMARTFQTPRLLPTLGVLENVAQGANVRAKSTLLSSLLYLPGKLREERSTFVEANQWLRFAGLGDVEDKNPTDLAYGDQRRLEIARCLMAHPQLLLLDEPAAGMNPAETLQLAELLLKIRDLGITLVLIEHDMSLVTRVADRVVATDSGQVVTVGDAATVLRHPTVVASFLGA